MDQKFLVICCVVLAFFCGITVSRSIDADFVEENGKALKNLRVLPGARRTVIKRSDLHSAEEAAGKAVLKLLDAKIGSKVQEAANEVSDFLKGAIGQHAKVRSDKLRNNKDKELSLLSLSAGKKAADKHTTNKKKKESFLLNFKIPYLVTPVKDKKKQPKKKKFHGHKPHPHKPHHKLNTHPAKPHPAPKHHPAPLHHLASHPHPHPHPAQQPHLQHAPPAHHSTEPKYMDLEWDGYNWSARPVNNNTASDPAMTPCQGSCMDPCSSACNLQTDCCCCPSATQPAIPQQPAPVPLPVPAPAPVAPAPSFLTLPAAPPAAPATPCPAQCGQSCLSFCPQSCCGVQGKRSKVAKSPENSSGSGSGSGSDDSL